MSPALCAVDDHPSRKLLPFSDSSHSDQIADQELFGNTSNPLPEGALFRAVASMREMFGSPDDVDQSQSQSSMQTTLWPVALQGAAAQSQSATATAQIVEIPEFVPLGKDLLPLTSLENSEQRMLVQAQARRAAQLQVSSAASNGQENRPTAIKSATVAAADAPASLAGRKRERSSPSLPAAEAGAEATAESSAGQPKYEGLLSKYPDMDGATRQALHSFLVLRCIQAEDAPPGLTDAGHCDFLLAEKREMKNERPVTYRYQMRLYFDGSGKFIERKVKVRSSGQKAAT